MGLCPDRPGHVKFRHESEAFGRLHPYALGTAGRRHLDARQEEVQRPGHAVQVQRIHEKAGVADLPPAAAAHEATELLLGRSPAPRGLLLERAERPEVALDLGHPLHLGRPERSDQLGLQVGDADVEAQPLQMGVLGVGGIILASAYWSNPFGPKVWRKLATFFDPPIATTETPSASRDRPRRSASASTAR